MFKKVDFKFFVKATNFFLILRYLLLHTTVKYYTVVTKMFLILLTYLFLQTVVKVRKKHVKHSVYFILKSYKDVIFNIIEVFTST